MLWYDNIWYMIQVSPLYYMENKNLSVNIINHVTFRHVNSQTWHFAPLWARDQTIIQILWKKKNTSHRLSKQTMFHGQLFTPQFLSVSARRLSNINFSKLLLLIESPSHCPLLSLPQQGRTGRTKCPGLAGHWTPHQSWLISPKKISNKNG